MKKVLILAVITGLLLLTGCETAADLLKPEETEVPKVVATQKPVTADEAKDNDGSENESENKPQEPQTTIACTQILQMTNEWTIMGDYRHEITKKGKEDRVVLATSAQSEGNEMLWDDSQYWTLAVIASDGAYNLFSENMPGYVYAEVNEGFVGGITTTVITAYIFSNTDREIRNYIYDSERDVFVEYQEYTTKSFSTGGINNLFTSMPKYKPW